MMSTSATDRLKTHAARAVGRVFHLYDAVDTGLPHDELFRPYARSTRYGFSHINVVIPDLPAPHRHLGCMVLRGRPGATVFDNDFLPGSPRDTVTLTIGTAATGTDGFRAYSTSRDCDLHEDGSYMRFGRDLTIAGHFPEFAITVNRGDLHLEINAVCLDQPTTFVRNPIYDHLGYPARYEGTLTWKGTTTRIRGVLSLEYARASALTSFHDRPVPSYLKLPVTHFEWQVIKLSPDTLLMFAESSAFGKPLLTSAYLKQIDGISERHIHNVTHEALSYLETPAVGPDGNLTRIPHQFRWRIHDPDGQVATEIVGTNDTDLVYGVGRGWLGGFTYTGTHHGTPVNGTAYMEYARLDAPDATSA